MRDFVIYSLGIGAFFFVNGWPIGTAVLLLLLYGLVALGAAAGREDRATDRTTEEGR